MLKKYKVTFNAIMPYGCDRGFVWVDDNNKVVDLKPSPGLNLRCGFVGDRYVGYDFSSITATYNTELVPELKDTDKIHAKLTGRRADLQEMLDRYNNKRLSDITPSDLTLKWQIQGRVNMIDEMLAYLSFLGV